MTDPIANLLAGPTYAPALDESLFLPAADACYRLLCLRFPAYRDFLQRRLGERAPEALKDWEELDRLPAVFLPVLKQRQFFTPPGLRVATRLTSSGTTGRPSEVPLDAENMQRRVAAMALAYRAQGLIAPRMNAVAFLMDPATTQMAGSVVIDAVLRSQPEVRSVTYLARMGAAGPEFDRQQALAQLQRLTQGDPLAVVGYPALMVAAIEQLRQLGQNELPLPAGSFVLTGGGWKSFLPGVSIDSGEFQQLASDFFHLPRTAIRDMFGLSECPAVFLQSPQPLPDGGCGYLAPSFVRVEAIDPETLRPVPAGETGLLQLTTPLTTSYPLLKILTTDKVRIIDDPAGVAQALLIPQGRVTAARFETCAMKIGQAVA